MMVRQDLTVLFGMVQQILHSLSRKNTRMHTLGKIGETLESTFILARKVEFLGNPFSDDGS